MIKRRGPQVRMARLSPVNHAPDIAAMDLFVVPTTIGFELLYAFRHLFEAGPPETCGLDQRHDKSDCTEWIARQLTEGRTRMGAALPHPAIRIQSAWRR